MSLAKKNGIHLEALLTMESLLAAADQVGRARLLSASRKETGMWLNAVPIPSLGTQLAPEVLRVAIALRVGARVCEAHSCRCGLGMNVRGLHGLSCRYNSGRHTIHSAMNDVVKRALQRARHLQCWSPLVLTEAVSYTHLRAH